MINRIDTLDIQKYQIFKNDHVYLFYIYTILLKSSHFLIFKKLYKNYIKLKLLFMVFNIYFQSDCIQI